jgi:VanZ family protein
MSQHSDSASLSYRGLWLSLGALLLAVILVICLIPLSLPPAAPALNDKLLHFLTFGLLAVWFGALVTPVKQLKVMLLLLGYGLLIEVLQSFTGFRNAELLDLVADAVGILIGWALLQTPLRNWPRWCECCLPRKSSHVG